MSEDAGIEPKTVATFGSQTLPNHLARSHPQRRNFFVRSVGQMLSGNVEGMHREAGGQAKQ